MDEHFVTTVETALTRAGVCHAGATLLLALSGGADSVALLHALCAIRARRALIIRAAHVEHGLRGESSLADAAFCEQLCRSLDVPFTCDHAALPGGMNAPGAEARARDARYALLLRRARECKAVALLTAHHQDDQAETVLARLLRGSGARGLSGMRERTTRDGVAIVRPLLTVSKQALLNALGDLPYRTDESNLTPCCQRNRLRAEMLPLFTRENPRACEHIAQSAALLAMDDAYLSELAETLLRASLYREPPLFCLRAAPVADAPDAVKVRVLRAFVQAGVQALATGGDVHADAVSAEIGELSGEIGELTAGDTLALRALLRAPVGTALNLPYQLRALKGAAHLHLTRMGGEPLSPLPAQSPVPLRPGMRQTALGAFRFSAKPYDPLRDAPPDGLTTVALPDALLAGCELRTALAGDRITPFGASGGKLLRRYLTDRKLDAPFRAAIPLVCAGDRALWVCGVGAAETTRLGDAPATLLTLMDIPPWLPPTTAAITPTAKE